MCVLNERDPFYVCHVDFPIDQLRPFLSFLCRALEGCTYVFHVATPSPYFYSGREGLVDIPREGAKRIFKAIEEAGCVKRVVVTSTMVSCMGKSVCLGMSWETQSDLLEQRL